MVSEATLRPRGRASLGPLRARAVTRAITRAAKKVRFIWGRGPKAAPEVGLPVPLQSTDEGGKLFHRDHLLWVPAHPGGRRSIPKEAVPRFDVY